MTKAEQFELAVNMLMDFSSVKDAKLAIKLILDHTEDQFHPGMVKEWQGVLDEIQLISLERNPDLWYEYVDKTVQGSKGEEGKLIKVRSEHKQLKIRVTKEKGFEDAWHPMNQCNPVVTHDPDQKELNFHDGENRD